MIARYLHICILFLLIFVFYTCDESTDPVDDRVQYEYTIPEETGDGWTTTSLSAAGFDEEAITAKITDYLNQSHFIEGILIIKDGQLVLEEYFPGRYFDLEAPNLFAGDQIAYSNVDYDSDTPHFLASVSKSITSAIFGIAVDQGHISGTDAKMFDYFPDYSQHETPDKLDITLEHLLTMTSGFPFDDGSYPIYDHRNDEYRLFFATDAIGITLEKQLAANPGVNFDYNSGGTCILGEIVSRSTGADLVEYADTYLFAPLGITDYNWASCPNDTGIVFASGGLYMRPRDMAKIGQLFLDGGTWDSAQLISSEWITESTLPAVSLGSSGPIPGLDTGYGYQWWTAYDQLQGTTMYLAAGWGGQFIIVVPGDNMVVVFTQGDYDWEYPYLVFELFSLL